MTGVQTCALPISRGSFRRSSYGMNYGVDNGWVGDEVPLMLEFEAKRR